MVEFLKEIKGKDFIYEKGKRYTSMEEQNEELKGKILVRQPNSPKKTNWWTIFPIESVGTTFRIVDNCEMSLTEMIEENKQLEY